MSQCIYASGHFRHFVPVTRVILLVMVLGGCGGAAAPAPGDASLMRGAPPREPDAYFIDVAAFAGIDFRHTIGDDDLSNIVETVGSGAAFLDFDGDGFLDLYLVNGAHRQGISDGERPDSDTGARLYRNLGGQGFADVTASAGVSNAGNYGMGVAAADYDNDGDPDLFVCNYGPNVLFRNNGDGTFTDIAADAGVAGAGDGNTVGAVWLDYDNDGYLDLYAGNYSPTIPNTPSSTHPTASRRRWPTTGRPIASTETAATDALRT